MVGRVWFSWLVRAAGKNYPYCRWEIAAKLDYTLERSVRQLHRASETLLRRIRRT